jgi:hypothetical protein
MASGYQAVVAGDLPMTAAFAGQVVRSIGVAMLDCRRFGTDGKPDATGANE